jgi:hypothetical protein
MGAFQNPVHSILQGILTGYSVANQLRRAALEEQEMRRRQEQEETDAQLKDLEARLRLAQVGRPVIGGTVTEPPPEGQSVPIVRPPRGKTIKYKSRSGEEIEVEPYSPEELEQRRLAFEKKLEGEKAQAHLQGQIAARQQALQTFGVPIGPDLAKQTGLPEDTRVLPTELDSIVTAAGRMAEVRRKIEEEKTDPVANFYPAVDDSGNVTLFTIRRSGKIEQMRVPKVGKTSEGRLSPTERRLQKKEEEDQRVGEIVGEILGESGFDPQRALKKLEGYFVDRPHLQKYRSRVYFAISSRLPRPDQYGPAATQLMQQLAQPGSGTAGGTAPVAPAGQPMSREASEYLKKHGLK